MRDQAKNGSHLADEIRVEMAAPAQLTEKHALTCPPEEKPAPCARFESLAASYQDWLESYVKDHNRIFGVYRPTSFGRLELSVSCKNKVASLLGHYLSRYRFFPRTKVPSWTFPSDDEAILNDWAIVGTDLFEAMQQYKIVASHVADPASLEHPTTTSR
jgi:hypothetical protein